MADSELGELRRPPRGLEHRIERTARWRAQGLAGGTSDSTFPVDFVDNTSVAGASEDASAGGIPEWFFETFSVTSAPASTVTLTYVPLLYSEVVRLNGVTLSPVVDYTISENVLTYTDLTSLRLGIGAATWVLDIHYAYTETAQVPFEARDMLLWQLNGDASIVGATVQLNPASSSKAGAMVCQDVIPSGWVQIDVATNMTTTDGDGWQVILWDAAQHTTAEIDVAIGVDTYYSVAYMNTWPASNVTTYASHDGATYISNNQADDGTQSGAAHDYLHSWVRTGASTARLDFYRDSVLVHSSPVDVWTPATAYVAVYGYAGGLASNSHVINSASISVTS